MKSTRLDERLYRALARRLLPPDVVAEFEDRIVQAFCQLRDEARVRRGILGVLIIWAREVWQMARNRAGYRPTPDPVSGPPAPASGGRSSWRSGWAVDARQAWRGFLRRPSELLAVVATLALGIGSSTAIFGVAQAVLLAPLPLARQERVVRVGDLTGPRDELSQTSVPNFVDWSELSSLSDLAASWTRPDIFFGDSFPEPITSGKVTSNFLDVAGVRPVLGRGFTTEEGATGATVAILSHAFWRSAFGSDPDIVGREITLDSGRYRVIGVLGPDVGRLSLSPFDLPVLTPFAATPTELWNRRVRFLRVLGRLAPGVAVEAARAEARALAARLAVTYPDADAGRGIGVVAIGDVLLGDARAQLLVLGGGCALLLLIACANAAGVLTGRALNRRGEMAVRHALGADRGRLVRLGLLEGTFLAAVSLLAGLMVAAGLQAVLLGMAPEGLPRLDGTAWSPLVLVFATVVSFVAAIACSLVPTLGVSRALGTTLRGHGRTTASGARTRELLIVSEVALALVLVIAGGLLGSSLWRLASVDPGYDPGGVLAARVSLPAGGYPTEARPAFFRRVVTGLEAVPGVQGAATSTFAALTTGSFGVDVWVDHAEVRERGSLWPVSAGYFRIMRIEIEEGRGFTAAEEADGVPVIVIGRSAARRLFGRVSPLGAFVRFQSHLFTAEPARRVIGVVEDVRHFGLDGDVTGDLYVPHGQFPGRSPNIVVRSSLPTEGVVASVRQVVAALDPSLAVDGTVTLDRALANSLAVPRFSVVLLLGFAAAGVVLIAVGIFGVVAHAVARRLREVGIRMALGANRSDVLRLFLRTGMVPSLVGVALGLLASTLLGPVMASIAASAPPARASVVFGGGSVLLAVALLASVIGARSATRVEPRDVLAAE